MTQRLTWVGTPDRNAFLPWAPARDLEEADLARLVYRRTVGTQAETTDGLRPGDAGYADALAGVVADLLGSALYADPDAARHTAPAPTRAAAPTPAPAVAPEPLNPDEPPAVEASEPPVAQEPEA